MMLVYVMIGILAAISITVFLTIISSGKSVITLTKTNWHLKNSESSIPKSL